MNKNIKEFLDDKLVFDYTTNTGEWYELNGAEIKDLIEMITRECVDVIHYHMSAYPNAYSTYQEGIHEGMVESIRLIENAFGLE